LSLVALPAWVWLGAGLLDAVVRPGLHPPRHLVARGSARLGLARCGTVGRGRAARPSYCFDLFDLAVVLSRKIENVFQVD
jgi:hypothetical protein